MTSKRQVRRRQCGHKRQFADFAQASRVARYARLNGNHMTPYPCHWCGKYHIGHTPWHVRKAIREARESR